MPITTATEKPSNSNIIPNPITDSEIPSSTSAVQTSNNTTKTKTEAEEAADRLYEERIEEEYAKREGGA